MTKIGLGVNLPEYAVYPVLKEDSEGNPVTAENNYVLHFEKGKMPPVDAFWSLTMYDKDGFTVPNELKRYAIGDRSNLKYNEDGSVDIYFQHKKPSEDKISNWLPSPKSGAIGITLRLYVPQSPVLTGEWIPPAVTKIN